MGIEPNPSEHDDHEPSVDIVNRFKREGAVDFEAVPLYSLSVLWYLDPDGDDHIVWKFDGQQRSSVTIGDLHRIVFSILHEDFEHGFHEGPT